MGLDYRLAVIQRLTASQLFGCSRNELVDLNAMSLWAGVHTTGSLPHNFLKIKYKLKILCMPKWRHLGEAKRKLALQIPQAYFFY